MSARLFDTHIVVDWSARNTPSPAAPSKDAIWIGVERDAKAEPPRYFRTRHEAIGYLADTLATEAGMGRRILVGFDFPFGYPAGVAQRICGSNRALDLWDWFAGHVVDNHDNASNRFVVAERINALYEGVGPFWGKLDAKDYPGIPVKQSEREGEGHPPERRHADTRAKGAKTVWQVAYAGSVGSQVILGLPALAALRSDPRLSGRIAVWPFETGLEVPEAQVVLAEVYPSLWQAKAHRERREDEVMDSAQVRVTAAELAGLDARGDLAMAFRGPRDLDPETREVIAREEAWILGLDAGAEVQPVKTGRMRYERDPAEIYHQSFETVRAEARLDRFPAGLQSMAIRLIHACGMIEVADRLAFSPDAWEAGRAAMLAGAPVLCDCEMVAAGIIRRGLPAGNEVIVTLNDPGVPARAEAISNTRSAAAVELWERHLDGAVVAIGNAPTALFHLLEMIEGGAPKPAVILGFPVGFVGAAESKAELAAHPRGCEFVTLKGRRGGSAMASAAVNALAAGLPGEDG